MKHLLLSLALACGAACAQGDGWVDIAANSTGLKVTGKAGTVTVGQNDAGEPIVAAIFKNDLSGKIELVRMYVRIADCRSGIGSLVTVSIEGAYVRRNDYVSGAGTVASQVADTLCLALGQVQAPSAAPSRNSI